MSLSGKSKKIFDAIKRKRDDGLAYWYGSDLSEAIGCPNARSFECLVRYAKSRDEKNGADCFASFERTDKATGETVTEYVLTRKACRLIAAEGDPADPRVMLAREYFAQKKKVGGVFWRVLLGVLIVFAALASYSLGSSYAELSRSQEEIDRVESEKSAMAREAVEAGYTDWEGDWFERLSKDVVIDGVHYEAFVECYTYNDSSIGNNARLLLVPCDVEYLLGENGKESTNSPRWYEIYAKKVSTVVFDRIPEGLSGYFREPVSADVAEPYCIINPNPQKSKLGNYLSALSLPLVTMMCVTIGIVGIVWVIAARKNAPYKMID